MKLPERMITSGKLPAVKNLLLVGTALIFSAMITPAMAVKPVCDEGSTHPSCKSDDSDDGTFQVDISGATTGGSIADWTASFGGKDSIGNNEPTAGAGNVGVLDLKFFEPFFAEDPDGTVCFLESGNLNQAIIQKGKRGRAEGLFWFTGVADDLDKTPVLYLLKVFGVFGLDDDWPPVGEGDITTLIMDDWEMHVENVGGPIRNNSCVGEGEFDAPPLSIEVTRTN